MSSKASSVSVR